MYTDSISIPTEDLAKILAETSPGDPLLPELDRAQLQRPASRELPASRSLLAISQGLVADIGAIPQTTYSLYREYGRTGYWQNYGRTFFLKRAKLTAAALRLLLGKDEWLDAVHDYIWNICEETNWVISYHETREVDLFSAETAAMLAEIITSLGHILAGEVCQRAREEIERRVFEPYLERHKQLGWYKGTNNWNGVCNGSIGSAFLWLEEDPARLAKALSLVLDSLDLFLHTAFEEDGASTEGPGYWLYGLIHTVVFAELLRQRTQGRVDLLAGERMKRIAAYPTHMMLSVERYANFSDCEETVTFYPGMIDRLAERTGMNDLLQVLAKRDTTDLPFLNPVIPTGLMRWNYDIALRTLLWWDGGQPEAVELKDAFLPDLGYAKLMSQTPDAVPVVLAFKAGHNAENHNHNDVGSFILHVDGETFLCDPGRGLYDSTYFTDRRYENLFASSAGHSLPVVGGHTQSPGLERRGHIEAYEPDGDRKRVVAELAAAYDVPGLTSIRRALTLADRGPESGTVWLEDHITFANEGEEIVEALMTWLDVQVSGGSAVLSGESHALLLTVEEPAGAAFEVQDYKEICQANEKPGVLKRLALTLAPAREIRARVRMEVKAR